MTKPVGCQTRAISVRNRRLFGPTERPGLLTIATVMEAEGAAYCDLTLDDGKSIICSWPLSNAEMAAWHTHPDTFFGVLGQRTTRADGPLDLYEFFLSRLSTDAQRAGYLSY